MRAVVSVAPHAHDLQEVLYSMKGEHYGTYAYLISPSAAETLLQHAYPAYAQVCVTAITMTMSALRSCAPSVGRLCYNRYSSQTLT